MPENEVTDAELAEAATVPPGDEGTEGRRFANGGLVGETGPEVWRSGSPSLILSPDATRVLLGGDDQ